MITLEKERVVIDTEDLTDEQELALIVEQWTGEYTIAYGEILRVTDETTKHKVGQMAIVVESGPDEDDYLHVAYLEANGLINTGRWHIDLFERTGRTILDEKLATLRVEEEKKAKPVEPVVTEPKSRRRRVLDLNI